MTKKLSKQHDVIVIGAGVAGLSAALVLARARADVLVIDAGEPRNAPASHMHGFVSRDGISPAEFLATGRQEVSKYGGTIEHSKVSAISRRADGKFDVTFLDAKTAIARSVLIATGLKDELPDIPGVREHWGSLVNHCPYCHGREVSAQKIAVIGGHAREMSIKQAGLLRSYSERVDFITNGIVLTVLERQRLEAFGVKIIDGIVSRLAEEAVGALNIALADGQNVWCEAIFIAPIPRPTNDLLLSLECEVDESTGLVVVDSAGQTSQPGVWAAGNVVTPSAQVITAAGAGSTSAIAINGWLVGQNIDAASKIHNQEKEIN